MRLKYNNNIYEIEHNQKEQNLNLIVNDEEKNFNISKQESNFIRLEENGKIKDAYFTEDRDKIYVQIDAKQYIFKKLEDEDDIPGAAGGDENREEILPPMPGSIIKVNVKEGDEVNEGDAVVIVEAMKMETSLYSRISGKVTKINVKEGDKVGGDDVLVVIEK